MLLSFVVVRSMTPRRPPLLKHNSFATSLRGEDAIIAKENKVILDEINSFLGWVLVTTSMGGLIYLLPLPASVTLPMRMAALTLLTASLVIKSGSRTVAKSIVTGADSIADGILTGAGMIGIGTGLGLSFVSLAYVFVHLHDNSSTTLKRHD